MPGGSPRRLRDCLLRNGVACRNKYGEYFGITVAGYPEAHPDAIVSDPEEMDKIYWKDLYYLKEKVPDHFATLSPASEQAFLWPSPSIPVQLQQRGQQQREPSVQPLQAAPVQNPCSSWDALGCMLLML